MDLFFFFSRPRTQVVNEYTDWERTVQHPVNTRDACVQALSDAQFVAPLVQTGDLFTLRHTKKPNNPHISPVLDSEKEPMPKTYFYVFDYQTKDGDYPQVRREIWHSSAERSGVRGP